MASQTVTEPDIAVTTNRSVWRLQRWQWVTIILLSLGQGFSVVYSPNLIVGRILGGVITLYLLATLFRFVCRKVGLTGTHTVLAVSSIVASLIVMPLAVFLINPLYFYPLILLLVSPIVWVLATGYDLVAD